MSATKEPSKVIDFQKARKEIEDEGAEKWEVKVGGLSFKGGWTKDEYEKSRTEWLKSILPLSENERSQLGEQSRLTFQERLNSITKTWKGELNDKYMAKMYQEAVYPFMLGTALFDEYMREKGGT